MSAIKLALIPPYYHINSIGHTDYQLLLPQCFDTPKYVRTYARWRREGHFMILDNGIAEGVETTPDVLHALGREMMVNEIVIPDTLGDMERSVAQARQFEASAVHEFAYMGVVQGQTLGECYDCIRHFSDMPYIRTLGVPRHLLTSVSEEARALIVAFVRRNFGWRFAIHLLGTNPQYINELESYGQHYKDQGVRGVDTSAPFVYALDGASLLEYEKKVPRQEDYFNLQITDHRLTYTNIQLLKGWTYGRQYTNGVR